MYTIKKKSRTELFTSGITCEVKYLTNTVHGIFCSSKIAYSTDLAVPLTPDKNSTESFYLPEIFLIFQGSWEQLKANNSFTCQFQNTELFIHSGNNALRTKPGSIELDGLASFHTNVPSHIAEQATDHSIVD